MRNKRFIYKIILASTLCLYSHTTFADSAFTGRFTTITESDCNYMMTLSDGGSGILFDICRKQGNSGGNHKSEYKVSWKQLHDNLIINIKGADEKFTYKNRHSCKTFGQAGYSSALIGYGYTFWKTPIECKP